MDLVEKIIKIYPSLNYEDFFQTVGTISLQNDSDGRGDYIAKWEHSLPRPTQEQLDAVTGA
jgi:hypothetical protein